MDISAYHENVERRFHELGVTSLDLLDLGVVDVELQSQVELVFVNAPGDLQQCPVRQRFCDGVNTSYINDVMLCPYGQVIICD